jgi:fused signal recognition particle receptor
MRIAAAAAEAEAVRLEAQRAENERIAAEQRAEAARLAQQAADLKRLADELAESRRREAARERILAEEAARVESEAAARVKRDAAAWAELERCRSGANTRDAEERAEAQRAHERMLMGGDTPPELVVVQACRPEDRAMLATPAGAELVQAVAAQIAEEEPSLLVGTIGTRLGFQLRAEFIEKQLGIKPAARRQSAVLWSESAWPQIKAALIEYVRGLP